MAMLLKSANAERTNSIHIWFQGFCSASAPHPSRAAWKTAACFLFVCLFCTKEKVLKAGENCCGEPVWESWPSPDAAPCVLHDFTRLLQLLMPCATPIPVLPDLPSILTAHWGLCYPTTGLHSSRCFWEQADPSGTRKAEPGDTGPAHTASASLTPPGVPSRTGTAASLASGIGDLTFGISPWWWSVKMGCFYPSERANSKNDF